MVKSLVVTCPECGKAKQLLDTRRSQAIEIGKAVRRAAADGLAIQLATGAVEVGCECAPKPTGSKANSGQKSNRRYNLRQLLLLVTVIAILLSVFRNPISLMFRADAKTAAWIPWSVYGWLFFGWEVENMDNLSKNPITAIMLTANAVLAVLAPIFAIIWGCQGFKFLWEQAKDDDD